MSPLQRIAMGMVIVLIPADFGSRCHAYDALPDPIGWLLVLSGVWALGRVLDVDAARWAGVVALLVSVPLWLPQVSNHLVEGCGATVGRTEESALWALSLPPFVFGLLLCRAIGRAALAQEPRDSFVAGRFGVLTWGFAACVVLPAVGYGAEQAGVLATTLVLIGVVQVVFVYYLFRVHRRPYLGGPGALEVHPPGSPGRTNAAPDEPERRS